VTPEELDPHFSLERPNPLANGGGCDPKFDSGARKIAVPGAGSQNAQRIKRGQSFDHSSFEATLQMIVKDCSYDSESDSIHFGNGSKKFTDRDQK
jgi:hypothetical protein